MNFFESIATDFLYNLPVLSLVILLLPLLSFAFLFFFANNLPGKGDVVAVVLSGLAFLFSLILFIQAWGKTVVRPEPMVWFEISSLKFTLNILINDLSAAMLLLVSFISFLVHLYSLEYMKGKKNYLRYFPYLGIFTFSMTGIVLSDNLLLTFMFWELVGFSSYLLIGFWYEKEAAVKAAKKAFLFNRIGDTGFIIAILVLYSMHGNLDLTEIKNSVSISGGLLNFDWMFWIGMGIFLGCVGKSAQFPLQAWLPDAMEGPTPASALIHAATMVAAGVYLLIKVHFLLNAEVLTIIAFVGAITAFMGALPALFQNDIKKVLAYSTVSQLGYMVMAVGVGAYDASFFHLITHGFFKACLFLSAGAVIHAMHDVKHELFAQGSYRDFDSQDMRLMGGLKNKMPLTFVAYLFSACALVGLPLFSGFLSKDAILEGAGNWAASGEHPLLFLVPVLAYVTVFLTALYMTRQIVLVFLDDFRLEKKFSIVEGAKKHLKDPSWLMTGPLLLLVPLCIWIFFSPNPLSAQYGWLFHTGDDWHLLTALASIVLSLGGLGLGYYLFRRKASQEEGTVKRGAIPQNFLKDNWYLDRIYYSLLVIPGLKVAGMFSYTDSKILDGFIHFLAKFNVVMAHVLAWLDKVLVDGIVRFVTRVASGLGALFRSIQSGKVQGYFIFALLTSIALMIWIIIA